MQSCSALPWRCAPLPAQPPPQRHPPDTAPAACRWRDPTARCRRCGRLQARHRREGGVEWAARAQCSCPTKGQPPGLHTTTHPTRRWLHPGSRPPPAPSWCAPCTCAWASARRAQGGRRGWRSLAGRLFAGTRRLPRLLHLLRLLRLLRPLPTCVLRSQNRTVVSPLPLARWRPSGEKLTDNTASVVGRVSLEGVGGWESREGALGSVGEQGEGWADHSQAGAAARRHRPTRRPLPRRTRVAGHAGGAARDGAHAEYGLRLVHHPQHALYRHLQEAHSGSRARSAGSARKERP